MPKGLTFIICFGSYGGFRVEAGPWAYRVCIGWVSVSVALTDIEKVIDMLLSEIKKLEEGRRNC